MADFIDANGAERTDPNQILQTNAVATGNGTQVAVRAMEAVILNVSGITSATIIVEGTSDNITWNTLTVKDINTGITNTAITANGYYFAEFEGLLNIRARISAYTSGTINVSGAPISVTISPSQAPTGAIVQKVTSGPPATGQTAKSYVGKYATGASSTAPAAPTVAAGAAGLPNGVYKCQVTFVSSQGETTGGTEATVTVTNQQISWSVIPTGPAGTTARKLYRTAAGGATGTEKLVTTINDNTTTTFTDNVADGSLGAAVPTANTFNQVIVTLETVTTGKAYYITDLFVNTDQNVLLDFRLQANGVDIFRQGVRDLAPLTAPGIDTQPNAASGQSVTVVLPPTTAAQNVWFNIFGYEQ